MVTKVSKKTFLYLFICLVVISSCGKVVQNVSEDKDDEPVFKLVANIGPIALTEKKESTAFLADKLSVKPQEYSYLDTLYVVLKGYEKSKVKNLAYATLKLDIEEKELAAAKLIKNNKTSTENIKSPEVKKIYKAKSYDASKIEITKAKKSQFSSTFTEKTQSYKVTTDQVSKKYDYYILSNYKNNNVYQMKLIEQQQVSENKLIELTEITPYDTFKALVVILANRSIEVNADFYDAVHSVLDETFFDTLNYSMPTLESKSLYKKSVVFKFADPLLETCVDVIDLLIIDKKEAEYYLKNLKNKIFTQAQSELFLEKIKGFNINLDKSLDTPKEPSKLSIENVIQENKSLVDD